LFENNQIDDVRIYKRFGLAHNKYDQEVKRITLLMNNNWYIHNKGGDIPIGTIFPMKLP
jgi:hypothetical protein